MSLPNDPAAFQLVCVLSADVYKPGDPAPRGYLQWHEWARVQHKAKLKQRRCWSCGLWKYPQEECCGPRPETEAKDE